MAEVNSVRMKDRRTCGYPSCKYYVEGTATACCGACAADWGEEEYRAASELGKVPVQSREPVCICTNESGQARCRIHCPKFAIEYRVPRPGERVLVHLDPSGHMSRLTRMKHGSAAQYVIVAEEGFEQSICRTSHADSLEDKVVGHS